MGSPRSGNQQENAVHMLLLYDQSTSDSTPFTNERFELLHKLFGQPSPPSSPSGIGPGIGEDYWQCLLKCGPVPP